MPKSGVKLLWGTANLFSHRRYMSGAATNPDPEVFAYAAAQVKNVLEMTHELKGENYVLWGGREGYETLLNTDVGRELDQLGKFLNLVVEHKHKIGFKGLILIEPEAREPTKHQYDYDVATVYGFLQPLRPREGGQGQHRAEPCAAGRPHLRARDRARARAGHLRLDRHEPRRRAERLGHRPVPEQPAADGARDVPHHQGGGFTSGGLNFDAKVRRQSIDPDDS
jgi:xylose isomerase